MGILMIALERLTLSPEPTKELIKDYWLYSQYFCPSEFRADAVEYNPWFFDKDNKLVSLGGKLGEPEIWYNHLKDSFFKKRGYQLIGDPKFVLEGDVDTDIRKLEFDRIMERYDNRKTLEQRFLDEDDILVDEETSDKEAS